ncbi:MAG TPA: hypothetical protein VNW50_16375, partial [Streptosporangiaceae bacterium]|nr:hypothetical protein [Streptosporangiaceae bacterium]
MAVSLTALLGEPGAGEAGPDGPGPYPTATVTSPDQVDLSADIVRIWRRAATSPGDQTEDIVQAEPGAGLEVVKSPWSG